MLKGSIRRTENRVGVSRTTGDEPNAQWGFLHSLNGDFALLRVIAIKPLIQSPEAGIRAASVVVGVAGATAVGAMVDVVDGALVSAATCFLNAFRWSHDGTRLAYWVSRHLSL